MTVTFKAWRSKEGELFHDGCFEEEESVEWRAGNGYTGVSLDDLEDNDVCESCGGEFVLGPVDDDSDDEESDEDEPETTTTS